MVAIIKDYKKKQINQKFIDEVGERVSSVKKHYDDIIKESRRQKKELEERLRESGLHGVKSFEIRNFEEFANIEKTMNMIRDYKEISQSTKDLLKKVGPLTAIDEKGNIRKV
uniref:Uncharacterized protein n=1 Tax=Caldisericum exile TaxID=693075 RepID=A0A7C4U0A8_9BACT